MKLVKVEKNPCRGFECTYKCSDCGETFDGSYRIPNFCPNCGRKLDKTGKPGTVEDAYGFICWLIANAINTGLLVNANPKFTEYGESWTFHAESDGGDKL